MIDSFENPTPSPKERLRVVCDEAKKIDPFTMEAKWEYGQVLDPYGLCELPPERRCVGRLYFARRPGSDIWVEDGDLPPEVLVGMPRALARFEEQLVSLDWLFSEPSC